MPLRFGTASEGSHVHPTDDSVHLSGDLRADAYIEVLTDAYEAPPMYKKLHENLKSFYNIHSESEAPLLRLAERSAHWTPHSGRVGG